MIIALNGIHGNRGNQVPWESRWLCTQKCGDHDPSILFDINDCGTGFSCIYRSLCFTGAAALT